MRSGALRAEARAELLQRGAAVGEVRLLAGVVHDEVRAARERGGGVGAHHAALHAGGGGGGGGGSRSGRAKRRETTKSPRAPNGVTIDRGTGVRAIAPRRARRGRYRRRRWIHRRRRRRRAPCTGPGLVRTRRTRLRRSPRGTAPQRSRASRTCDAETRAPPPSRDDRTAGRASNARANRGDRTRARRGRASAVGRRRECGRRARELRRQLASRQCK